MCPGLKSGWNKVWSLCFSVGALLCWAAACLLSVIFLEICSHPPGFTSGHHSFPSQISQSLEKLLVNTYVNIGFLQRWKLTFHIHVNGEPEFMNQLGSSQEVEYTAVKGQALVEFLSATTS